MYRELPLVAFPKKEGCQGFFMQKENMMSSPREKALEELGTEEFWRKVKEEKAKILAERGQGWFKRLLNKLGIK